MNRFERVSRMARAVLEIVRISLALAGVFVLIDDGSKAYEAYTSQFWPTTTGVITRSSVDVYADSLGNRSYRSTIEYAYAVDQPANDDDYLTSYRVGIDPIPRADSRAIAEARLKPYPKGSFVEVYYNPNRPKKSLLEPDFSLAYLIKPVVGLVCLGAAISLWMIERVNNW